MAKILLVEDDNNLREIYQARMQAEGYIVVTASDGEEALAIAAKEKPDLIISDVMMPKISGFEMLDILRNTEGLKTTKVIMLTALGQAEDKTRADSLGADKYLVKSQVTLEDIVNTARELLADIAGDTPAGATPAPAEPAPTAPAVPAPVGTPQPQQPVAAPVPTAVPNPAPAAPAAPQQPAPAPAPVAPQPAPVIPVATPPAETQTPAPTAPSAAQPAAAPSTPAPANGTTAPTMAVTPAPAATPVTAPTPVAEPAPQPTLAATPAPTTAPAATSAPATPSPAPAPQPTPTPAPAAPAAPVNAAAIDDKVVSHAIDQLLADTDQAPASAPAPQPAPAPAAPAASAAPDNSTPTPAIPPQPVTSINGDKVEVAGKKVIAPISQPENKPSLDELLAKENGDTPHPAAPSAIDKTPDFTPPQPGVSVTPQNGSNGFDPNSISL